MMISKSCLMLAISISISAIGGCGGSASQQEQSAEPDQPAKEPLFLITKVDGPVHDPENWSFWYGPFVEASSIADFDGDGHLDIAAGKNMYYGPDWKKYPGYRDGADAVGFNTDENSEFALDVNNDGRPDVVDTNYWKEGAGVYWNENPGVRGGTWKRELIHARPTIEGAIVTDLSGRGGKDILEAHFGEVEGSGLTWLEHIDEAPWYILHDLGPEGDGHGTAAGDINSDGRNDIVTAEGWWESPPNPSQDDWIWHPDWELPREGTSEGRKVAAAEPFAVLDFNDDGLMDFVTGLAHTYGLVWYEQKMIDGNRSFELHWIEKNFSGFHTVAAGDVDGDGKLEIVTGKKLFQREGRNSGGEGHEYDPLFVFWYKYRNGRVERHPLFYNNMAWYPNQETINPPPNYAIGVGYKINIADLDNDGRNDIICTDRPGLYVFYNKGFLPGPKEVGDTLLVPQDDYPNYVPRFRGPRRQVTGSDVAPAPARNSK